MKDYFAQKLFVFYVFLLMLSACHNQQNSQTTVADSNSRATTHNTTDTPMPCNIGEQPLFTNTDSLLVYVDSLFWLIDNAKEIGNFDSVGCLGDAVISLFQKNKNLMMHVSDKWNDAPLSLSKSSDGNFCLISWNTQMGGSMIDYVTMAFYKTSDSIKVIYLNAPEGSPYYDTIFTIKDTDNKSIYMATGFSKLSGNEVGQGLRAFSIEKDSLVSPNIFADTSQIFVVFNKRKLAEDDNLEIPSIGITKFCDTISVPKPTEHEGFANQWQQLIFNGKKYVKK